MRIFVTGATGFIGSAVAQELLKAGHQVLGLARSDAAAASLTTAGVAVHRGDVRDPASLRSGAAAADGVIHTGFIHDFAKFKEVCEIDRHAIEALAAELAGSNRPLLVTSGTAMANEDGIVTVTSAEFPRAATEEAARAAAERGVRISLVRCPPSVHGEGDHGFVPTLINIAREKGLSVYAGDGQNRWPAVHRLDAARVFSLALEKATAGVNFHAVAEEGIAFRDLATTIGKHLNAPIVAKSPEEAGEHFGWFAHFAALDCPASSQRTREQLGWHPEQPGLIRDLEQTPSYFTPSP